MNQPVGGAPALEGARVRGSAGAHRRARGLQGLSQAGLLRELVVADRTDADGPGARPQLERRHLVEEHVGSVPGRLASPEREQDPTRVVVERGAEGVRPGGALGPDQRDVVGEASIGPRSGQGRRCGLVAQAHGHGTQDVLHDVPEVGLGHERGVELEEDLVARAVDACAAFRLAGARRLRPDGGVGEGLDEAELVDGPARRRHDVHDRVLLAVHERLVLGSPRVPHAAGLDEDLHGARRLARVCVPLAAQLHHTGHRHEAAQPGCTQAAPDLAAQRHELGRAVRVLELEEHETAEITTGAEPAAELHLGADVQGAELAAGMASVGVH